MIASCFLSDDGASLECEKEVFFLFFFGEKALKFLSVNCDPALVIKTYQNEFQESSLSCECNDNSPVAPMKRTQKMEKKFK
jgi:hypothetical protein